MDFARGLFAQEKKALGGIAPAPTIRRRPGRSYRKRWPTGHGTDRDHVYVQNPPHVQPPHSARPFVSPNFNLSVNAPPAGYERLLLVPFHGNLAVPREWKVIIRTVLVIGIHSIFQKLDPTLIGRWELRKNGIPVDNLTEMHPGRQNDLFFEVLGAYPSVYDFTPLHAPVHGKGGDVFEVRARTVLGGAFGWIASVVVSGYMYPMQSSGDTIREAWADKPTSA